MPVSTVTTTWLRSLLRAQVTFAGFWMEPDLTEVSTPLEWPAYMLLRAMGCGVQGTCHRSRTCLRRAAHPAPSGTA